jgi:hypothetical protein
LNSIDRGCGVKSHYLPTEKQPQRVCVISSFGVKSEAFTEYEIAHLYTVDSLHQENQGGLGRWHTWVLVSDLGDRCFLN